MQVDQRKLLRQYKTFSDGRDDHTLVECLGRYGEEGLETLHRLAGEDSTDMVHCAAYALSRIAHKRSMLVLRDLARKYPEHDRILSASLWGLARMADSNSADLFRQAVLSSDAIVSRAGILGLRMSKDKEGALLLVDLIKDRNAAGNVFRNEAVSAIIDIGDKRGLDALTELLRADLASDEPLLGEREWAWYAKRLPPDISTQLLLEAISERRCWGNGAWRRREAIEMLAEDNRTGTSDRLRAAVSQGDPVWVCAQQVLEHIVETPLVRPGRCADSECDEREHACVVLMRAGAHSVARVLLALLDSWAGDVHLAIRAAEWLRVYGDQAVAAGLLRVYEALPNGGDSDRIYSALKQDVAQAIGTCGTVKTLQSILPMLLTEDDRIALYGLAQAVGELAISLGAHHLVFDMMIDVGDDEEHLRVVNEAIKHTGEFISASHWHEAFLCHPRRDELEVELAQRLEEGSAASMFSVAVCGLTQCVGRLHAAIETGDDKQARSALDGVLWLGGNEARESLGKRIRSEVNSGCARSSDDLLSSVLVVASALGCTVDLSYCLDKDYGWFGRGALLEAALKSGDEVLRVQAAEQLLSDHRLTWVDGTTSQAIRELGGTCPEVLANILSSSDFLRTWPDQYLSSLADAWLNTGEDGNAAKAVEMLTRITSRHARRSIAIAINRLGSDQALRLLLDLSLSPSPRIRTLATEALAWQRRSDAAPRLGDLMGDESSEVRSEARASLETIDERARQQEYLRSVDWRDNLSALSACNTLAASLDDLVANDVLPALYGEHTPIDFAREEYLLKYFGRAQERKERDERNDKQKRDWFQLQRVDVIAGRDEEIVTIGRGLLVDGEGLSHPADYSIAVRPAGPVGTADWRGVAQTLDGGIALGCSFEEATLVLDDGRKGQVVITNSSFASWRDGDMIEFLGQGGPPA